VHADGPGPEWVAELHARVGVVTTQPSAYSAVSMSVPARMRNGAPRLTMSNADGIGGSLSRAYGGAPSR